MNGNKNSYIQSLCTLTSNQNEIGESSKINKRVSHLVFLVTENHKSIVQGKKRAKCA
jgi:hypothetical protein